jgi:hypothetical protein
MSPINQHFGLVIAYLLPGFIGLGGIALLVPSVASWLRPQLGGAGFGPPVYAVLAAIAIGMVISCVRWLIIDQLMSWSGVKAPKWDGVQLESRLNAFNYLVESHYRYYQFYSNGLIAIIWTYAVNRHFATSHFLGIDSDLLLLMLCATLFAGARDALQKYYRRTEPFILSTAYPFTPGEHMTNGCHRDQAAPPTSHSSRPVREKPAQSQKVRAEKPKLTTPKK